VTTEVAFPAAVGAIDRPVPIDLLNTGIVADLAEIRVRLFSRRRLSIVMTMIGTLQTMRETAFYIYKDFVNQNKIFNHMANLDSHLDGPGD
jgi:hypothetical protein